jgi:membrane protein implicated in regulation of membrane protease activity
MNIYTRIARFIVPACMLLVAGMRLADAVRGGGAADWFAAAGFAGVAVMLYLSLREAHRRQHADATQDDTT